MTRTERARLVLAQALVVVARRTHPDAIDAVVDAGYSDGYRTGHDYGYGKGCLDGHAAARRQIAERLGDVLAEVQP